MKILQKVKIYQQLELNDFLLIIFTKTNQIDDFYFSHVLRLVHDLKFYLFISLFFSLRGKKIKWMEFLTK